jgi:hypothetical protein
MEASVSAGLLETAILGLCLSTNSTMLIYL